MELTATDLLHGAVYALEQAGLLLHDAFLLFLKEHYSSSVVLAVFSKEEMGRFEILLDNYEVAESKGTPISGELIMRQCDDHAEKLRHSYLEDELDLDSLGRPDLAMAILKGPWGSKEHKEAMKQAQDLRKRLARRMPHDLHRRRVHALYVEPSEDGKNWNRPVQTSRKECLRLLEKASYEYDARFSWYEVNEKEASSLVSRWSDRPVLPKSLYLELLRFTTE